MSAARRRVVIAGGGAAGTLLAIALLRVSERADEVVIVEPGVVGCGVAYGTNDPQHLLNVTAARMSALADQPDHLLAWARSRDPETAPSDFLPRLQYARYLRETLEMVAGTAAGTLQTRRARVVTVADGTVSCDDRTDIEATATVLALGNPMPAPPGPARPVLAHHAWIGDPWGAGALDRIDDGGNVLLLGTGLTMVDMVLSISRRCPATRLLAISRHGMLPFPHSTEALAPRAAPSSVGPGMRPSQLMHALREDAEGAADWRQSIDALRPGTQELWASLSLAERGSLLRHAARHWGVRRNRMAPHVAERLAELVASGVLRVTSGSLRSLTPRGETVEAEFGDGSTQRVQAVINCTGPNTDLRSTGLPVVRSLLDRGTVRQDAFRLGLDTTADGALIDAAGAASTSLYAIGPVRRGTLFESSAIPEIRDQGATLAGMLMRGSGPRIGVRPGGLQGQPSADQGDATPAGLAPRNAPPIATLVGSTDRVSRKAWRPLAHLRLRADPWAPGEQLAGRQQMPGQPLVRRRRVPLHRPERGVARSSFEAAGQHVESFHVQDSVGGVGFEPTTMGL